MRNKGGIRAEFLRHLTSAASDQPSISRSWLVTLPDLHVQEGQRGSYDSSSDWDTIKPSFVPPKTLLVAVLEHHVIGPHSEADILD